MPDSYTKLLMHCNASPFVDVCGKTVTNNNGVTLDTDIKEFGAGSASFNGTNYLSISNSADTNFGTGDFTVELWCRFNDLNRSGPMPLYDNNYTEGIQIRAEHYVPLKLSIFSGSGTPVLLCDWGPVEDTWYHVAVTRASGTLRAFINGNKVGEVSLTRDITTTSNLDLGKTEGWLLDGYIDEIRISKGIARWTSNFTPQTAEYNGDIVKRPLPTFFRV